MPAMTSKRVLDNKKKLFQRLLGSASVEIEGKELADLLGVSERTLTNYKSDPFRMTALQIAILAELTKCEIVLNYRG